jgi:tetratricopeptide (TPR) repeat protein
VYARHRTTIDTRASTTTIRQVASALGHLGLAKPALRALRMRDGGDDPHHAIAIAEAALDAGVVDLARETLERVRARAGSEADLGPNLHRISARLAAAQGHPDRVDVHEGVALAPVLARDLARAWMARGEVAVARGDWIAAADAYRRAQAVAPDDPMALTASARLVQASAATQAAEGTTLGRLAEIDDAVVRRATALVTATREAGGFATPPSKVEAPRER